MSSGTEIRRLRLAVSRMIIIGALVLLARPCHAEPYNKFSTKDGFAIELPSDWVEVPQSVLNETSKYANQATSSHEKYDYAYQPSSQPWLSPPYILVQVRRSGKPSEEQFNDMKKATIDLANGVASVQNRSSGTLTMSSVESVNYDPVLHILWSRVSMFVRPGEGKPLLPIQTLSGLRLTEFGTIQLSGYAVRDSFEQYRPVFERAVKQMYLSPEISYKPGVVTRSGGIVWMRVIKMALVGAAIALFAGFVRKQMKK